MKPSDLLPPPPWEGPPIPKAVIIERIRRELETYIEYYIHKFDPFIPVRVVVLGPDSTGHNWDWVPSNWYELGISPYGVQLEVGPKGGLDYPKTWYLPHIITELVHWKKTGQPYTIGVFPGDPRDWIDAVYLAAEWGVLDVYEEVFRDEIASEILEGNFAHRLDVETAEREGIVDYVLLFKEELEKYRRRKG